ncbi:daunorubicin C-13 ketoreductase [Mucilaginibacter sp. MD40]|uniref:SDR family NAD(P)-dependent oxidoreductase n=1 Tax=Mucilaginibacter sp. MD40 TaxID=2029590 RepID=UPI000BACCCA8|nr:SDR family NAD(P)-dependent oxidoreductase [Mucilaginibacter sp. MD40]PAW92281.1 daunorubicin C-13 ketoreductase [Mucilaginibacter sp. MD40]
MAKIFITGSADGLGLLAAKSLIEQGHQVVLHARNSQRADEALRHIPVAKNILIGDLADADQTKALADQANTLGTFDAVIHNAGVYQAGHQALLQVNVVAPYLLTAMMHRPERLIYLSSGMHLSGHPEWTTSPSYADTKLQVLMLAKAIFRRWPDVYANAVDPGWVPTKMGGAGAPDDLDQGYQTQTWLATSHDPTAMVSGRYFHHLHQTRCHKSADDLALQDDLLLNLERFTGAKLL